MFRFAILRGSRSWPDRHSMFNNASYPIRQFAVGALHIKHEPLNAVVAVMGVSATAFALSCAMRLRGSPGKMDEQIAADKETVDGTEMDNATVPATRGSLAFKGRTHWPALDEGLNIFEARSGRSSEELLNRIIAHASFPTCLPALAVGNHGERASVELTASIARGVLCHAVLCNGYDAVGSSVHGKVSSKPRSRCASDDFSRGGGLVLDEWLSSSGPLAAEKAACMMFYLDVATRPGFDATRKIRFSLQHAPEPMQEPLAWPMVHVHTGSMWQRDEDSTFVNFGNASFLFGKIVPSNGGVSVEEFLQMEFPELAVGMLYFGQMRDDEAVVVRGVQKYSNHKGYMKSFACDGACSDKRIFTVVTMDAKNYNPDLLRAPDDPEHGQVVSYAQQFSSPHVIRDVAKARAAFQGLDRVATGMWGCGQFKGNVYLKFLEQLVAASQVGIHEFSFSAFGAPRVAEQCEALLAKLNRSQRTPEDVLEFLSTLQKQDASDLTSDDAFLNHIFQWLR